MYREYVTKSQNINYVRGKIELKQHLLHNQNRNDKIFCSFSEITVDTLENRIIKLTLFYLLQYFPVDDNTRVELLGLYKKLNTVGNLKSFSRNIFGSITYTPLNADYIERCSKILNILDDVTNTTICLIDTNHLWGSSPLVRAGSSIIQAAKTHEFNIKKLIVARALNISTLAMNNHLSRIVNDAEE